jgi:hypothetical protein
LNALCNLSDLIRDPTKRSSALLLAAGEPAYGVLHTLDGLPGLIGCLSGRVLGLACHLLSLPGGPSGHGLRSLRSLCSGSVFHRLGFHRLGRLYNVTYYDASVAASALDLREVYAPLPRLAAGRVRGLDFSLAPDLIRVQVGDVLLGLVDALLHRRVVIHQLLKECLEGFLSTTRDLVWQSLQRGTIISYVLLEHFGRITKIGLRQVHSPLLDLSPGLLDALV